MFVAKEQKFLVEICIVKFFELKDILLDGILDCQTEKEGSW